MSRKQLTRRDFLNLSAGAAVGTVLAACNATPVVDEVEKVVTKEVVKEVEKEVEKIITVEVEKEVEKVVTATPVPPEPASLTFSWWVEGAQRDAFESYLREFEENNQATVELQIVPWDNYWDKLPVSIAAGTASDLFFLVSGQVQNFAAMGGLLRLTDYLPGGKMDNFRPAQVEFVTYEGDYISMPFTATVVTEFVNQAMLENAGLTAPATADEAWDWEELAANLQTIKDANDGVVASMLNGSRDFWWLPWFYSNGATVLNETRDAVTINSPEAEETLTYLADLTAQGLTGVPGEPPELFIQEKVAIHSDGHWGIPTLADSVGNAFEFGVIPFPKRKQPGMALGGDYLSAYIQTEHPGEAAALLDFLTSAEILNHYCSDRFYLSPRTDLTPDYGDKTPLMEVVDSQTQAFGSADVTFLRGHSKWDKMRQVFQAEYELAMLGEKSPAGALAEMEARMTEILAD